MHPSIDLRHVRAFESGMVKKVVLPVVVVLVVLLLFFWRQQPEQVVKRQSDKILAIGSLPENLSPADLVFRSERLRGLLDPDIDIYVEAFGRDERASGRDQALAAFQLYTRLMDETTLTAAYGNIEVAGQRAVVPLRLRARMHTGDGEVGESQMDGRFEFRRNESGWDLLLVEFIDE